MTFFEIGKIFVYYIAPWSLLPSLILGIKKYKYLTPVLRVFLYYILLAAAFCLTTISMGLSGFKTLPAFHIYSIFEFAMLSYFYSRVFGGRFWKIVLPVVILFGIGCIINMLYIQTGIQYNTYTRPVSTIIIIVYCLMYINRQNTVDESEAWSNKPLNWINTALLIYYSGSLLTFIFSNYFVFQKDQTIGQLMWFANPFIGSVECLLFAVGYYKHNDKR